TPVFEIAQPFRLHEETLIAAESGTKKDTINLLYQCVEAEQFLVVLAGNREADFRERRSRRRHTGRAVQPVAEGFAKLGRIGHAAMEVQRFHAMETLGGTKPVQVYPQGFLDGPCRIGDGSV